MRLNLFIACWLLIAFSLPSCNQSNTISTNGFDQICAIYTQILYDPKHKELTLLQKLELMHDEIIKQVKDTDALQTYSAVATANPDEKYKLFKESAEYSLKRQWDCPVMIDLNTKS